MEITFSSNERSLFELNQEEANQLQARLQQAKTRCRDNAEYWRIISKEILTQDANKHYPFSLHLALFKQCYPNWPEHPETAPAWFPEDQITALANISRFMTEKNFSSVHALHEWSVQYINDFWQSMLLKLNINFQKNPDALCDLSEGIENPQWLPGALFNIADSCFQADPSAIAIIDEQGTMTFRELDRLSNRVANSLVAKGLASSDAIGIIMPLTRYAVAIYLGILKIGGIVVSIADSFSADEIATRLTIARTKLVFTQDFSIWGEKNLPLYEKIAFAKVSEIIVLSSRHHASDIELKLRVTDSTWQSFLALGKDENFMSHRCHPMDPCHLLFSSGTTGAPKAIPWTHTTPIKSASDAFFHHNIQIGDVLCWPTNLGWMMGPWLLFAAFINKAAIAIYTGLPKERGFGEFIQRAGVTMLGVVPTLVASWRQSRCMENLNWHAIKLFSSTGECSNPEDMLYLMSLAGYKPIIEYCGGTEIGGGFVSSTVIQENYPSLLSTPAIGSDFIIINDAGQALRGAATGEIALIPPTIGLSISLLL